MVIFTVGGTEYSLAFSTSAMKAYQREQGETVITALQSIEGDPGNIIRLSALFRAAAKLSEDQADALMDDLGLAEVFRLVGEAAKDAFRGLTDPNPPTQP